MKRKQPEALARAAAARAKRTPEALALRNTLALERIAAALESVPQRLALFVQRAAPITTKLLLLLALVSCTEGDCDECDVREHLDTTGNVQLCACVCDDEALRCPPQVPDCWDEGSST